MTDEGQLMGRRVIRSVVFDGPGHLGTAKADKYCRTEGWSIGPTDMSGMRAVIFAPGVRVAKWRNLSPAERDMVDAVVTGHGQGKPKVLHVFTPRQVA